VDPIRRTPPPPPPPPAPPRPPAPPPPTPDEPTARQRAAEAWVDDRADWIGGAVVTCDLTRFGRDFTFVWLDPAGPMNLGATVDPLAKFPQLYDGRIRFSTTEPSGEVTLSLQAGPALADGLDPDEQAQALADMDPEELLGGTASQDFRLVRVRWSGATPGSTVACDAAEEPPTGTLTIFFEADPEDLDDTSLSTTLVKGCGNATFALKPSVSMKVEAGACQISIERRNATVPLAIERLGPFLVDIAPGEHVEVELPFPEEPPMWAIPDLDELEAIADITAWTGSELLNTAAQSLLDMLKTGQWSPREVEQILTEVQEELQSEYAEGEDLLGSAEEPLEPSMSP
ncbi:MAG: hypothetical protein EA397_15525, partial [Deltaproteobacteria bacterium]